MKENTCSNSMMFMIGALLMVSFSGCAEPQFAVYQGKSPLLNISVDYIVSWKTIERNIPERKAAHLLFLEPSAPGKELPVPYISLNVKTDQKTNLDTIAEGLVKVTGLSPATVLARSKFQYQGVDALDMLLSFKTPDKLHTAKINPLPAKMRVVAFQKGGKDYVIRFFALEGDFTRLAKSFEHVLKSLEIR